MPVWESEILFRTDIQLADDALLPLETFSVGGARSPAVIVRISSSATTVGPVRSNGGSRYSGPVPGQPNYAITAGLGRQVGSNLFHSFGRFNINTGERATFSGPATVENILSRVTGGTASSIDGLLRTDFPGASPNLFLMNPSGVMFGPNAQLDVQGSFHATTADFIELADGVRFNALPSAEDAVLTTAPPEAFGFLDDSSASILFEGSQLQVPEGETFSVVGGDILMQGRTLSAPSGGINLASVASVGRAVLAEDGLQITPLGESAEVQQGDIKISQASFSQDSLIEVSGSRGAGVFIRGGRLILEGTLENHPAIQSNAIDISVTADLRVERGRILGSFIDIGSGAAGDVDIKARRLTLERGTILASTSGVGRGGNLAIEAGELSATDSFLNTTGPGLFSSQDTGDMTIRADRMQLDGQTIVGTTVGSGAGGDLTIETDHLRLDGAARIRTTAFSGNAGDLSVTAQDIVIEGQGPDVDEFFVPGLFVTAFLDAADPGRLEHFRRQPAFKEWGSG